MDAGAGAAPWGPALPVPLPAGPALLRAGSGLPLTYFAAAAGPCRRRQPGPGRGGRCGAVLPLPGDARKPRRRGEGNAGDGRGLRGGGSGSRCGGARPARRAPLPQEAARGGGGRSQPCRARGAEPAPPPPRTMEEERWVPPPAFVSARSAAGWGCPSPGSGAVRRNAGRGRGDPAAGRGHGRNAALPSSVPPCRDGRLPCCSRMLQCHDDRRLRPPCPLRGSRGGSVRCVSGVIKDGREAGRGSAH